MSEAACPPDSAVMRAWKAYQETESFKNSFLYVTAEQRKELILPSDPAANAVTDWHRDQWAEGSMWTAFMRGWLAARGTDPFALLRLVKALEFIRDGYADQDINHVDYRVGAYKAVLAALALIQNVGQDIAISDSASVAGETGTKFLQGYFTDQHEARRPSPALDPGTWEALDAIDAQLNEMRSLKGWRLNLIRDNMAKLRRALLASPAPKAGGER